MRYFIGLLVILTVFTIPQVFASCIVNEDWPDAPCLDSIGNGYYDQDDVNRWAEYYSYKGTEFMEQKRAEMSEAIKNDTLQEWVAESIQNENVYSYYFFSGRVPDVGLYGAQFDEFGIWQNPAIHEPFDNSDIVLVGTIVQVTVTPENKTQYDFKVDKYLKGEKPSDLITATLDSIRPDDFPKDPLDYFNRPYFEKDNQVLVYLKQDGSTFQMSPYSFTVKKPTVAGPPNVIHATGPHEHIIPQGKEIVISGTIKKAYLYSLEKSGFDSSFDLVVLNENEELVDSKKLDINLDGSYSFTFQEKNELRIPGKYSWDITYHNGGMGGEFIVKVDQKRWTPLKQFNAGMMFNEIQCNENLVLIQKYDGSPACVTEPTKLKLVERGWTKTTPVSVNHQPETAYNGPTDIPSANNQFAMNFYSQISQENTDNIFFSPASIFTAFAIAYEGAGSNTAKEMQDVFGFEPDDSARHERFADMQQRLNFEGQNNTLSIANALWLANHFEPYDDYVRNVENYYSGKVESVDFASEEKSLDVINQWIHDNTNGKIEKIFETLSPDTKLAITNAIYFKGMWEEPFNKDKTVMAQFHVRDDTTVSVPMMELDTAYLNQTKTPAARILELPYEGNKISMLILLPNEIGRIHSLEDSLSAENIRAWQEDYTEIKTKAYVPKFKLETDYDLIPPLVDLGVRDAFGNADFSGISELDLFIYKAVHKAFVEVNEEGTEAAAATGIAMMESGPVEFRADHPFVFIIQDNETGQILFMGRVMDPTQ